MDIKEIQSFIDQTSYDFGTVECFLKYGRIKETVVVMHQILARIQSFQRRKNAAGDEFKGVFQEEFWGRVFFEKLTMEDVRAKINGLAKQETAISENELEGFEYQRFIEIVRAWNDENVFKLKKIIKNPQEKRVDFIRILFTAYAIGMLLAAVVFLRSFFLDWGLTGDFYGGMNFEEHLSTGNNKIINFKYYLEMNPRMPPEHSSARWQGYLIAPKEGTYALSVIVDDGARLFIDDQLLIDAWRDNNSIEFRKEIFLSKGSHSIRLDYYNDLYDSILKLYWQFDGRNKEIIPAWYLRHKG